MIPYRRHAQNLALLLHPAFLQSGDLCIPRDPTRKLPQFSTLPASEIPSDWHHTPIWKILQQEGQKRLQRWGDHLRLHPDRRHPGRELLQWREVSLVVPPTILAATVAPISHIRLLDPTLVPSGPVAQIHAHVGNCFSFDLLWSHRAGRSVWGYPDEKPHPPPDGLTEKSWYALLKLAFLLRGELQRLLSGSPVSPFREDLRNLQDWIEKIYKSDGTYKNDIPHRALRPNDTWLRRCPRPYPQQRCIQSIWQQDPCFEGQDCPEVHLLHRCFQHLSQGASEPFVRMFTQYLRIQTMAYRQVTADPQKSTLNAFQKSYDAGSRFAEGAKEVGALVLEQEAPLQLGAVEMRTGDVEMIWRQSRKTMSASGPEIGWIFHFKRQGPRKEKPSTAQNGKASPPHLSRIPWAKNWAVHAQDAALLKQLLTGRPSTLRRFRGLDVAGKERVEPLWCIAPHLQRVRQASCPLRPLGLTLHVGEDHGHLATGLRAIHEPFAWGLIERGDRLGHALALGRDPEEWARKAGSVYVRRWDRLLDLAWMYYCTERDARSGKERVRLRREADLLMKVLFGKTVPLEELAALWAKMGKASFLRGELSFPVQRARPVGAAGLFYDYLWSSDVQHEAHKEILVERQLDAPLLSRLQQNLFKELGRWQVVIEVNPTSNMIVGGLQQPVDQPMYRLRPVHLEREKPALPVALCSDDPLAFATCLADEYAYAWAGLVDGGTPPTYAREWLREAAENSWRARFTLPRQTSAVL